ncbi:MAG: hypothetical protein ACM3NV_06430 [Syntrophothermus sp.]
MLHGRCGDETSFDAGVVEDLGEVRGSAPAYVFPDGGDHGHRHERAERRPGRPTGATT